jgi:hypothetical protein
MGQGLVQAILAALVGLVLGAVVYSLARRGRLTFRYTVGWLSLCFLGIVAGVVAPAVGPVAEYLHLSPAAFLSVTAVVILLLICVQLSISISGMQDQIRELGEEVAHLRLITSESDDGDQNAHLHPR